MGVRSGRVWIFVDWPLDLIVRFLGVIIGKEQGSGNRGQGTGDRGQGSDGIGDVVCVIFYVGCAIAENYCVIFYADCDGEFIDELDEGVNEDVTGRIGV